MYAKNIDTPIINKKWNIFLMNAIFYLAVMTLMKLFEFLMTFQNLSFFEPVKHNY